jgi:hypothetical protein
MRGLEAEPPTAAERHFSVPVMQGMQFEGLEDDGLEDDVLFCALYCARKKRLKRQLVISFLTSTLGFLQAYHKYRCGLKQVRRCQRSEDQDFADCFRLHARKRRLTRQLGMSATHCSQEINEALNQYKSAVEATESSLINLAPPCLKAFLQTATLAPVCRFVFEAPTSKLSTPNPKTDLSTLNRSPQTLHLKP